jgi:hypothetical protein
MHARTVERRIKRLERQVTGGDSVASPIRIVTQYRDGYHASSGQKEFFGKELPDDGTQWIILDYGDELLETPGVTQ